MPDLYCCACDEEVSVGEIHWAFAEDHDVMCDRCHSATNTNPGGKRIEPYSLVCIDHGITAARSEAERGTVQRIVERLRAKLAEMELHDETGDPSDYGFACARDEFSAVVDTIERELVGDARGAEADA